MDNRGEDGERHALLATGAGGVEMQQVAVSESAAPSTAAAAAHELPHASSSGSGAKAATSAITRQASPLAPIATCSAEAALDDGGLSKEPALCRICFEEDAVSSLEQPCGCAGTQRFAHHACIQRWVMEKGHLRCEVCSQEYRGAFEVPPPPPIPPASLGETFIHPLFGPMLIRVDADGATQRASALELFDEQDSYPHQRHPGTTWCFTFIIFIMFLVVMHHSLVFTDDGDDGSMDAGGVPRPGDGGGGMGPGGGPGGNPDAGMYSPSFTVFLLWVTSKALMIGIPLYVVMKIAARQAQREQYEAMLGAGQVMGEPGGRMVLRMRAASMPVPVTGPNAV